jgi:hypothetical protein
MIDIDKDRPEDESVNLYRTALELSQQSNEKKMILSGLGRLKSLSSLKMAGSYLEDQSLQTEAELAVLNISNSIKQEFPVETKMFLNQIINSSKVQDHVNQAKNMLTQIEE